MKPRLLQSDLTALAAAPETQGTIEAAALADRLYTLRVEVRPYRGEDDDEYRQHTMAVAALLLAELCGEPVALTDAAYGEQYDPCAKPKGHAGYHDPSAPPSSDAGSPDSGVRAAAKLLCDYTGSHVGPCSDHLRFAADHYEAAE